MRPPTWCGWPENGVFFPEKPTRDRSKTYSLGPGHLVLNWHTNLVSLHQLIMWPQSVHTNPQPAWNSSFTPQNNKQQPPIPSNHQHKSPQALTPSPAQSIHCFLGTSCNYPAPPGCRDTPESTAISRAEDFLSSHWSIYSNHKIITNSQQTTHN